MVTEQAKVIAYGVLPMQMETLTAYLHRQGISSMYHSKQILPRNTPEISFHFTDVQFVHAPFTHTDAQSQELSNVSVVICLPPSSLSTVVQPLDILHQEGGKLWCLKEKHITVVDRSLGTQITVHPTSFTFVSFDSSEHLLPLLFCSEREALTRTLPQEQTLTLAHALTCKSSNIH